jgi:2-oxoglutarate ferredoxin oxidoreductase subunit gamma
MQTEVMFAGFGGQGIMLIGQMLAYAGMGEGKNVVWLPSYGPEMRGGTAYCTVVVADRAIGSPIIDRPSSIVVMNRPSLDKFMSKVKPGGLLIINSSLIDATCDRKDIKVVHVPANQIALEAGTGKAANMAMLGAYLGCSGAVSLDAVRTILQKHFEKKPQLVEVNNKVLERGFELGKSGGVPFTKAASAGAGAVHV